MWDLKKKKEEDREHKIDTKSKWDIRYSEFEGKNREYYILERSERCSTLVSGGCFFPHMWILAAINEWLWVQHQWVSESSGRWLGSLSGCGEKKSEGERGREKCLMHNKCRWEVIEAVNAEGPGNKSCATYSLSAWGSFCICSRIMRMAGSLMICCTSGSAIARFFTSSGLSFLIAWLTMQRWMPSDASWEAKERAEK